MSNVCTVCGYRTGMGGVGSQPVLMEGKNFHKGCYEYVKPLLEVKELAIQFLRVLAAQRDDAERNAPQVTIHDPDNMLERILDTQGIKAMITKHRALLAELEKAVLGPKEK